MPGNIERLKTRLRSLWARTFQRSILKSSGLFDEGWYLRQNPDVKKAGADPFRHYLEIGAANGRQPMPLFDPVWYRQQAPANVDLRIEALAHYLAIGWKQGRHPHPLFDAAWYLKQNPQVAAARMNPLVHYVRQGSKQNLPPHPLFDPVLYRRQEPDCGEPLSHYIEQGSARGLKPHALFDPAWYRQHSPDVVKGNAEPLGHYLQFGWKEQRSPSPLFDPHWYLAQYPDVEAEGIDPLRHYLEQGSAENRMPNALFQPSWYRRHGNTELEPLSHYVTYGEAEDTSPIPHFQPEWYRKANQDVQTSGLGPFAHYLIFGRGERRAPMANWKVHRNVRRSEVLGSGMTVPEVQVAIGIVTYNNHPAQLQRCIRSAQPASVYIIDNGGLSAAPSHAVKLPSRGNIGFGAAHNILMTAAFEAGALYYIAVNPDGVFEPAALSALLQMQQACGGNALLEALQFPEEHPKIYADDDFETPWASGACLMIPRAVYQAIGGFDDSLFMYCEDVDLSWRARSSGFAVKTCPRALFYHPVSAQPPDHATTERYLRSGIALARKWGAQRFEAELLAEMERRGMNLADIPQPPKFSGPRGCADFSHGFSFAPVRW
jgi:hypothetical protein